MSWLSQPTHSQHSAHLSSSSLRPSSMSYHRLLTSQDNFFLPVPCALEAQTVINTSCFDWRFPRKREKVRQKSRCHQQTHKTRQQTTTQTTENPKPKRTPKKQLDVPRQDILMKKFSSSRCLDKASFFFSDGCMAQRGRCPGGRPSVSANKRIHDAYYSVVKWQLYKPSMNTEYDQQFSQRVPLSVLASPIASSK